MSASATSAHAPRSAKGLGTGFAVSAVVHVGLVAALVWWGLQADPPRPPVYRVELIGAPPGTRQAGIVRPEPTPDEAAAPAPTAGAERAPTEAALASKKKSMASPKATPMPVRSNKAGAKAATPTKKSAPPTAGSGREGGKGAAVANIKTEGIAFPYPGYLNNIVQQIALAYSPKRASAALSAEVKFLIHRDGSVSEIVITKSSGDRLFDLEARGTVEAVGSTRGFQPLPTGWADDVLIVYFTFDYALRP
jgi:protein TonB